MNKCGRQLGVITTSKKKSDSWSFDGAFSRMHIMSEANSRITINTYSDLPEIVKPSKRMILEQSWIEKNK
jgi:hypothetical protein